MWSSAICYRSATCRLQSETKQRTRVYAGLCGRCGWMCWEGEVVRLELGLRMLYLISQCRRRSGGRCRRRAKTSSYLVPVLRAALAWLASSCCQWPQRVQLLVTCAQPPSPHRPYWLRLSFSIRISRALSGPACDDPRTATIRHLRTCASLPLHLSPAKGSQWTHGAVRFTLLRLTLESTRFVGMKAAVNPHVRLSRENQHFVHTPNRSYN